VHQAFNLPLPGFLHVSTPHHYWGAAERVSEGEFSQNLATELDDLIQAEGPERVGAFIAEPVMAAGGVIVPPEGYFEAVQPVLDKHDVLFIVDEVVCGFGRLGTAFGSDYYRLQPDLMTLAKGLTSGYVPMSACLISEKVWDVLREGSKEIGPFAHGYTYSGHPLAAAAGLANLAIMQREELFEHAAEVGGYFQSRLRLTCEDHPLVGEVRGVGLIAGVELVADREKKVPFDTALTVGAQLSGLAKEEGLLCRALGNAVGFSPPLVISEAEVDEMCARLGRALERVPDELKTS
jgi:L-2,4-diaminobutyrate transaminase